MTFLWGVTQVTDYLTRMHTAHLANVRKSVTKNATFPGTGGFPCLITHSCMSATSPTVVGGLIFCISATPHLGSLFPLFHGLYRVHYLVKIVYCKYRVQDISGSIDLLRFMWRNKNAIISYKSIFLPESDKSCWWQILIVYWYLEMESPLANIY